MFCMLTIVCTSQTETQFFVSHIFSVCVNKHTNTYTKFETQMYTLWSCEDWSNALTIIAANKHLSRQPQKDIYKHVHVFMASFMYTHTPSWQISAMDWSSNKDLSNCLKMTLSIIWLYSAPLHWQATANLQHLILSGWLSRLDSRFILLTSITITAWHTDHRLVQHTCLAYQSFQQLAMQTQDSPTERELFTQTLAI